MPHDAGVTDLLAAIRIESTPRISGDDLTVSRETDLALVREYTKNENLVRHMLAVEAAVRAYARKFGEDEEKWGSVGLLHDFDYERWPDPPDHPLKGSAILKERGYPDDLIYAIKSHADYLTDCPRVSRLDKTLYACDELCGFITACALVRPQRLEGLDAKSVRKKMKQASFAAAVKREDITNGADRFGRRPRRAHQFLHPGHAGNCGRVGTGCERMRADG